MVRLAMPLSSQERGLGRHREGVGAARGRDKGGLLQAASRARGQD